MATARRRYQLTTVAVFSVEPGDRMPFVLSWHPSHDTAHNLAAPGTPACPAHHRRTGY